MARTVSDVVRTLLIKDPRGVERYVPVSEPSLTIGREAACTIRVDSQYVSRQHARIEQRDEGVVFIDLGSRNGSMINGGRVQGEALLRPGDVISIADVTVECLADEGSDGTTRTFVAMPRKVEPDTEPEPPDRMRVDGETFEVFIGGNKLQRRLSNREFSLLLYLWERRERVCRSAELGDAIWGENNWDPNMLHQLVHRLKDKVEPAPDKPRYVQTVPWIGYRLTA